jgi:hypothetical protein
MTGLKPCLDAERAPRSSLAGQAMANRDPERIPIGRDSKLATGARREVARHASSLREVLGAQGIHFMEPRTGGLTDP